MKSSVVAALAVAVVLAGAQACSSGSSGSSDANGSSKGSRSETSPSTAPSSPPAKAKPSPTGPCADGTCEVEVAVGDILAVPETYGLGPMTVKAITGESVELTAPLTGSGYSISGCSGGGVTSSHGGGGVSLKCDRGTVATVNKAMTLEVLRTKASAAVLRIEPAD
ncbi:hypothetical protein [Streptomyces mesophilus]|uniref:hypothetical protein n=1 Tax=Streptomyces mesophilus TaxID=1775132 RepID=UPI00331FA274